MNRFVCQRGRRLRAGVRRDAGFSGVALGLMLATVMAAGDDFAGSISFSRQVLPILSDNCFACHGPDDQERMAGLRLDTEEGAKAVNEYGESAVVPGDLAASVLIELITTNDPQNVMPPPRTGKKLTPEQVDILTRWVEQGAPYEQHWAFVPPERPEFPEVKRPRWPRNPIDHFVLARLEEEGIEPARRANRRTLARRATLDLTGLPPTPQEVEAFLNDRTPAAYEKLVDRLLESPRYGEHMARSWMDAARYADSHGYHIDADRHMWKWRDWVIDAFNRNQPYDEFTIEQLAGDLLPDATIEQKVASGYIRANMSTGEGGAIEDEYLSKYTFDRTETTGTIWMGLTLSCARCHTHKYDPITHEEYFGLYSFFHNLDEAIMDGNQPNPHPFLKLPSPDQERRLAKLTEQIDTAREELDAPNAEAEASRQAWASDWRNRLSEELTLLQPTSVTRRTEQPFAILEDGVVALEAVPSAVAVQELGVPLEPGRLGGLRLALLPLGVAEVEAVHPATPPFRLATVQVELLEPSSEGGERARQPLKLAEAFASSWEGDHTPAKTLDGNQGTGWSPSNPSQPTAQELFLRLEQPRAIAEGSELRVRLTTVASEQDPRLHRFRLQAATGDDLLDRLFPAKPAPWKLLGPLPAPDPAAGLAHDFGPETDLDLGKKHPGVRGEVGWHDRADLSDGRNHVLVNALHGIHGVYYLTRVLELPEPRDVDFTVKADDLFRLWVNGEVAAERIAKAEPGDPPVEARVRLGPGQHRLVLKVSNLQGTSMFAFDQDLNEPLGAPGDIAARLLVTERVEGQHIDRLQRYHRQATDPTSKQLHRQLAQWQEARTELDRAIPTTLVAREREEPRVTRILLRGEYDQPGDVVSAGVPDVLPPFPEGAPTNRLGLARWLMDPGHPLTARVTVNRFWQHYFGVGLVKTAEDFGVQGEHPSHPELLDWLATEFIASGWNVKHLQKLIVMSATYQQASAWRPDLADRDPENRLVARGPRYRVDGEVVRDTALAVSGLLVGEIGGPSVKPFEPPGLWEAVSFNNSQKYVQDLGEANYRRSLYTHWKRQSPPPNMMLFDAPSREYCVVRRPRTNTPLQAMVLMNDPQFVEASRAFAWRILQEGGDRVRSRLRYAFELAIARRPDPGEMEILQATYEAQLKAFQNDLDAARAYLEVGAFRPETDCDPAELAAWSTMASLILNLDESLTKN
jgi:hypothetical protein